MCPPSGSHVQVAMVDEQDLAVVDDEDRDGEINFFVDVSHGMSSFRSQCEGRSSRISACRFNNRKARCPACNRPRPCPPSSSGRP